MSAQDQDQDQNPRDISIFRQVYDIPSIKTDVSRWDRAWEKTLRTISASEDVFPILSQYFTSEHVALHQGARKRLCTVQKAVAKLQKEGIEEEERFVTIWMLLGEEERRRHLVQGMEGACDGASLVQDARALCPEVTIGAMLKRNGRAFVDFVNEYGRGIREVVGVDSDGGGEDSDKVFLLPSEWWNSAVKDLEPSSEEVRFAFEQLSIYRNEFIGLFICKSLASVFDDISTMSSPMKKVNELYKSNPATAMAWTDMLSMQRDKPIMRCENCTKSPEELGSNTKFMVCSTCKTKLDFVVHYCSKTCQKEDWRRHKKHCGKQKQSKKLPGTIHDPCWAFPDAPHSDLLRQTLPAPTDPGASRGVPMTTVGTGTPHPSRTYSPALTRQISLLKGDPHADYFLFDDRDRPVPVQLFDPWTRMCFRILRSGAMFAENAEGMEAMAEFLIKMYKDREGLGRERILAQFEREYGGGMREKVKVFEKRSRPGMTFLETMSGSMRTMIPPHFSKSK